MLLALLASATLLWTAPTTNEDGSPLTDLAGYRVYQGTGCDATYPQVYDINDPTAVSYVVNNLADGTYCFVATAYDTAGNESVESNVASKTVVTAPAPPTALTVANLTAFTVVKQEDRMVLVAVGTVPPDTACDSTQSVNGRFVVPRAAVTWGGSIEPLVVVADCS